VTIPFAGAPPVEVPLGSAPLVKVLAQMRFPVNAKIDTTEGVIGFQGVLGDRYPVMRQEQQIAIALTPGVDTPTPMSPLWRLSEVDGAWTVVLARDFVAIETNSYTSRADFLTRWAEALEALSAAHLAPAVMDRMGVRYINRIADDEALADLPHLVCPEVLGVSGVNLPAGSSLTAAVSQVHLVIDRFEMLANWGLLPPSAVLLPGLEGVTTRSWVLDIDVYLQEHALFSTERALSDATTAAERAYELFRWAVTDEFLRRHGGET
jgi:uncharacterized protein (TIGR04255 family)